MLTAQQERQGDLERARARLAKAVREVWLRGGETDCGGECGRRVDARRAFRCFYCGLWFGACCAAAHFGGPRPATTEGTTG